MRICLVNALSPPASGSRAERTARLAEEWARLGHHVTILRASVPRSFTAVDATWARRLDHPLIRQVEIDGGAVARMKYQGGRGAARLARRGLVEFVWPDWWAAFAVRAGRWLALRCAAYDVVVTLAFPWSDLLVGFEAARRGGAVWVADYGDPWSFVPTAGRPRATPEKFAERRLLRLCRGVVVTTEPTRRAFAEQLDFPADQVRVVPAGVGDALGPPPAPPPFVLCHGGAVYGPRASIGPFIQAVAALKQRDALRLIWCGTADDPGDRAAIAALADEHHDFVDQAVFRRLEEQAHVQIVFGNRGGLQTPAKLWRALGSGRKVLVICADGQDALWTLGDLGPLVKTAPNDGAAITSALAEFQRMELSRDSGSCAAAARRCDTWAHRAAEEAAFLEECAARAPARAQRRRSALSASAMVGLFSALGLRPASTVARVWRQRGLR